MATLIEDKICDSLRLNYSQKEEENTSIWLSKQNSLRILVGVLGMALPALLYIALLLFNNLNQPLSSISHYYYTRANSIFIIIISLLAIFLLIYKGHCFQDFLISSLAGFFALLLILFPTSNLVECFQNENCMCCETVNIAATTFIQHENSLRVNFHYISSGIFLALLAYMSIFIFTKTNVDLSQNKLPKSKELRNRIYKTCGYLILFSIIMIFLGTKEIILVDWYETNHLTFWFETLAVECFGISWLIKGGTLLKDAAISEKS